MGCVRAAAALVLLARQCGASCAPSAGYNMTRRPTPRAASLAAVVVRGALLLRGASAAREDGLVPVPADGCDVNLVAHRHAARPGLREQRRHEAVALDDVRRRPVRPDGLYAAVHARAGRPVLAAAHKGGVPAEAGLDPTTAE